MSFSEAVTAACQPLLLLEAAAAGLDPRLGALQVRAARREVLAVSPAAQAAAEGMVEAWFRRHWAAVAARRALVVSGGG